MGSGQWQDAVFVDGEFGEPAGGGTIAVRDNASGEIVATAGLVPFGGIGQSGLGGRSGGDSNIEEFTGRRWLTVNPGPAHYPY